MTSFSKYPQSLDDSTSLPITVDNVTAVRAEVVNRIRDAVIAIETELGKDPSSVYGTVKDRLDAMIASINGIKAELGPNPSGSYDTVQDRLDAITDSINSINTELGSNPSGSYDTVKARLDAMMSDITSLQDSLADLDNVGGSPTPSNKNEISTNTTGNGEPTGITLDSTPISDSYVSVFVNGVLVSVGDGSKLFDCYFSSDGGATAKLIENFEAGDQLIWNGLIAGYDLSSSDRVDLGYDV